MLKYSKFIVTIGVALFVVILVIGIGKIKTYIEQVDMNNRIGDMIIVGFRGTKIDKKSPIVKSLNDLNLGGVILFDYDVPSATSSRNIVNPDQTKTLVNDLKKFAPKDIFVAVDSEGGYVNRLKSKYGFVPIPSAQEIGLKNDPEYTREIYNVLAQQLVALGFNLNFAPVVDVNVNPDNPVIGYLERSFSADPEIVSVHAKIAMKEFNDLGIFTALKHFPGHGSSNADSHLGLVDITNTYQKEKELLPYKLIISGEQPAMVMTAHIIDRAVDPEFPATLSPIFLQDWLRNDLGYKGVIVSDDMQMGAIVDNYGFDEAIIRAINAGVDLLIFSNNNRDYDDMIAYKAVAVIKKAIADGVITKDRIIESSNRINTLREEL